MVALVALTHEDYLAQQEERRRILHSAWLFDRFRFVIRFRDKVMGGVPMNPRLIEGWLLKNTGIDDREERLAVIKRTLIELGEAEKIENFDSASFEQLMEAAKKSAAEINTCGFKRNAAGLYLEERQVKAAIKEAVNVLYAGNGEKGEDGKRVGRWGPTGKGPKSYTAERVYIADDTIQLGRMEPDGLELVVGHVTGPKGPQSTLGYYQYVYGATVQFTVLSIGNEIDQQRWAEVMTYCSENGLGALRSQGHGKFDVLQFGRLPKVAMPKIEAEELPEDDPALLAAKGITPELARAKRVN